MVIFGTGVVTGGLLVRHVDNGRERHPPRGMGLGRQAQPTTAGGMRIEFLRRVGRELELTTAQQQSVERILKEGQERMKKLMETVEPRRREEFKRTMDEFRAVLTPEQRQRLDDLVKQQQRAREQRKGAAAHEHPPQNPPPASTNS